MKKCFRPPLRWMICMILDCVIPTHSSVIQTIHCSVGLKCFFFQFSKMFVRHYCYVCIFHWYFTSSVETHLPCGGSIIIKLSQIVCRVCQWKNFENWPVIGKDIDKSKVERFWSTLYIHTGIAEIGNHKIQRLLHKTISPSGLSNSTSFCQFSTNKSTVLSKVTVTINKTIANKKNQQHK